MTRTRFKIKTPPRIGLTDEVLKRVAEKPGESYRELASYLEAQPNSVRNVLSRQTRAGKLTNKDSRYYLYIDPLLEAALSLEKLATRPPALRRRINRWLILALLLAPLVGYGLAWVGYSR